MFNSAQISEVARILLQVIGALVVSRGLIAADDFQTISGAVAALIGVVGSIYVRRSTGIVKAAALLPSVDKITVDPASNAANLTSDKIQTSK